MNIELLKQRITAARDRGNTAELERLQAEYRISGVPTTAQARGHQLPQARVAGGDSLARPAARDSLTRAPAVQGLSVAITPSVRDSLDDQYDGAETGGFLIGPITSDEIFVTGVIAQSGDEQDRTSTSTKLDLYRALSILETLPSDVSICGDWHVHPHEADTQPSSADLRSWEHLSEYFERPWVGIIARNAPVSVTGINGRQHQTSQLELNATLTQYENGRVSHRPINIEERSF